MWGGWGRARHRGAREGCIIRERTSEAVRQAVGGGCQSGWGRLLSVTNAIEAGTCRQGDSGWALAGRPGASPPPSNAPLGPEPGTGGESPRVGTWRGRRPAGGVGDGLLYDAPPPPFPHPHPRTRSPLGQLPFRNILFFS